MNLFAQNCSLVLSFKDFIHSISIQAVVPTAIPGERLSPIGIPFSCSSSSPVLVLIIVFSSRNSSASIIVLNLITAFLYIFIIFQVPNTWAFPILWYHNNNPFIRCLLSYFVMPHMPPGCCRRCWPHQRRCRTRRSRAP